MKTSKPKKQNWPRLAKNLAECSRLTRISRTTLQSYRKAGCDAFKANGKIDLAELEVWMDLNAKTAGREPSELQQARVRLLRAQAARMERENAIKEGRTADKSDVTFAVGKVQGAMFATLDRLKNQLPPLLKGMTETQIFTRIDAEIEKLKEELTAQYMALENSTDL